MFNFYPFLKFGAFRVDAEVAHEFAISSFQRAPFLADIFPHPDLSSGKYEVDVAGMKWGFPVGLAAGLDKNAVAIDFFSRVGFGAVEVGTVTPLPQKGNPRPRLFRYPKEKSLRNQMGFNNDGADTVLDNVKSAARSAVVGVNIGKNKVTPNEKAPRDYKILYDKFVAYADYLVINVSSPNTPGLRDLQSEDGLKAILEELKDSRKGHPSKLFIKISPDLADDGIKSVVDLALEYKLTGVIATNTTIMPERGSGGVSGELLSKKAEIFRGKLLNFTKGTELEVIGVGGIHSFDDLKKYWLQGGRAAQIYTSFIYQGPAILVDFQKEIDKLLLQFQMQNLEELLSPEGIKELST